MDPDGAYVLSAETTGLPTHWAPIPTREGDHSPVWFWRSKQLLWLLAPLLAISVLFTLLGAQLENLFNLLP